MQLEDQVQPPVEKKRDTMTIEDVYAKFPELKMANELSHAMSESLRLTQQRVELTEADQQAIKLLQGLQEAYEKGERVQRWMDGINSQLALIKADSEMKQVLTRLLEAYHKGAQEQKTTVQ